MQLISTPAAMHQNDGGAIGGGNFQHRGIKAESADVVYNLRACRKRTARNFRTIGIDGNWDVNLPAERFDDGNDPPQFLVFRNRCAARPARFSAYVQNVGALRFNFEGPRDSFRTIVI